MLKLQFRLFFWPLAQSPQWETVTIRLKNFGDAHFHFERLLNASEILAQGWKQMSICPDKRQTEVETSETDVLWYWQFSCPVLQTCIKRKGMYSPDHETSSNPMFAIVSLYSCVNK